ncbi:MAG: hypothetical protein MUC49_00420 [Raineya sp.]|jgi:hypothetical protein|nr:hypothetical protein [Raineya sp.]
MHLLVENFKSLIEERPTHIGWHWRGEATYQRPLTLKNCPITLKPILKELHNQFLQWHTGDSYNHISGILALPHISVFEQPLEEITINILGINRTGKIYEWLDNLLFQDDIAVFDTYIFVDNKDNFCHLILKNQYYIPLPISLEDFLYLYAQTRGIENLYYHLIYGVNGFFLDNLFLMKDKVFSSMNLDFCLEKFNEIHKSLHKKWQKENPEIPPTSSITIKISLEKGNFIFYIDNEAFIFTGKDNMGFQFFKDLYETLIFAEKETDYNKTWQTYASLFDEQKGCLIIEHTDKHTISIESVIFEDQKAISKTVSCDAKSFYIALFTCIEEAIQRDASTESSINWQKQLYKFKILYQLHYFGLLF